MNKYIFLHKYNFRTLSNISSSASVSSDQISMDEFLNTEMELQGVDAEYDALGGALSEERGGTILEDDGRSSAVAMSEEATGSNKRPVSSLDDRSCASSVSMSEETPRSKKRTDQKNEQTELLREFLNRRQPNPVDFLPTKPSAPKDSLQQFFESIASTMRTFSPLAIARIKFEISQMVGKEEIAQAARNENVQIVYTTESTNATLTEITLESNNET